MESIRLVDAASDGHANGQRLICASCGALTAVVPCGDCGRNPLLRGRYSLLGVNGGDPDGMAYKASDSRRPADALEVRLIPLTPEGGARLAMDLQARIASLREPPDDSIRSITSAFLVGRGLRQAVAVVQPVVEGVRLEAELGNRACSEVDTLKLLKQVLQMLVHLHDLTPPVPAGPVSPDRLLRRANGELLLLYPGHLGRDGEASDPQLMAPELAQTDWAPTADIYEVGLLGVRLLTGHHPETMADPRGWLSWEQKTSAPVELVQLLSRWLSPEPGERPNNAALALAELRALEDRQAPAPLLATPSSLGLSVSRPLAPPRHTVSLRQAAENPPANRRLRAVERDGSAAGTAPADPTVTHARNIFLVVATVLVIAGLVATWSTMQGLAALF